MLLCALPLPSVCGGIRSLLQFTLHTGFAGLAETGLALLHAGRGSAGEELHGVVQVRAVLVAVVDRAAGGPVHGVRSYRFP